MSQDIDLFVIFDPASTASSATKTHSYPVVPQVGDYVQLPGLGEMGVAVRSRIVGERITLKFRDVFCDSVAWLESYGWKVAKR